MVLVKVVSSVGDGAEDPPAMFEGAAAGAFMVTASVTRKVEDPMVLVKVVSCVSEGEDGPPAMLEGAAT